MTRLDELNYWLDDATQNERVFQLETLYSHSLDQIDCDELDRIYALPVA